MTYIPHTLLSNPISFSTISPFWVAKIIKQIPLRWAMKFVNSFANGLLAGGLEHEFYDFPSGWECHHP
jgi:hypothetical protein